MAGWFTMNAPAAAATQQAVGNMQQIMRPALPGGTAVDPNAPGTRTTMPTGLTGPAYSLNGEPIKVGGPANVPDPNNPNAQLAGYTGAVLPHKDASGTWVDQYGNPTNTGFAGMGDVPGSANSGGIQPSGAPQGGTDYRSQFMQIMGGLPATPANLAAKEKELQSAGFRVVRSGDGTAGKVAVPGGQIFDVIQGAHAGGGGQWQWMGGDSGGGSLGNFQTGTFTGGGKYPLASVMGEGLAQPWTTPFNAPDPNSVTGDKALQWQMGRGMDAIQRSAAAKGTLLTGGLLKSLDTFGQGLASTYYGDVYNRALGEYKMAHDIYTGNQDSLYSKLFGVAGLGQNAAANVGNAAGAYGQGASNTLLGQGNAAAGGTAAGGAAWSNAVGNIGNIAASSYQQTHQPQYSPYQGGYFPSYGDPNMVQGTGNPMNG